MAFKPDVSISVGLAVGALVYGVYSNATPTLADIRAGAPNDDQINSASKGAFITSMAVVGGVSLLARDPTIFVIGGAIALAIEWSHRHANALDPMSGKLTVPQMFQGAGTPISDGMLDQSPVG
jgi:hypothetical protein